jgi:hypothetical protein
LPFFAAVGHLIERNSLFKLAATGPPLGGSIGREGAIGSSGRRVFIWPSQDRVVARFGVAATWKDRPFLDALA